MLSSNLVVPVPPRQFDATVDAGGAGDFTSIAAAFASSSDIKQVFVREGIYIETADIVIPEAGALCGEFAGAVIILPAAGFGITMDGSARRTTAGTCSATSGSATVTGTGTSFTSLLPGDQALLNGIWHEIGSITSDVLLTLDKAFQGKPFIDIAFEGQSMFAGCHLHNVIVTLTTVTALQITQVLFPIVGSCVFDACGSALLPSVTALDCSGLMMLGVVSQDSPGDGIELTRIRGAALTACIAKNNVGTGYSFRDDTRIVTVAQCGAFQCGGDGFLIDGSCTELGFLTCAAIQCNSDGFHALTGSNILNFDTCIACNNELNGMNLVSGNTLVATCDLKSNDRAGIVVPDQCSVSNCNASANELAGIDASGSVDTVIANNVVRNNAVNGIQAGDDCIVSDNMVKGNTGIGISLANKDDCIIDGNRVSGSSLEGINIALLSTDNIVSSNNAKNNTGVGILDLGVGTIVANNKT